MTDTPASDPQLHQPRLLGTKHLNNGLFADYYLDEIVPQQAEWTALTYGDEARRVLTQLKTLRAQIHPETLDESQLEELWVKPILAALGHHFSVQVKIRYRERGYRKPDYVFVQNAEAAHALTNDIYMPSQLTHTLAVGDAKRWGTNLDQSSKAGDERAGNARNPSQQIEEYLRYSELPWGILTDGRIWRLYHRDTSKYNNYYAVDLDDLLAREDGEAFLYFFAFFRQAALTSGWLVKVLAGSEDYAQKLTDKLEDEVYEALEMIAQGYLDYRRNRLTGDATTLRTIYEESLVLLYRILFIFYAESREILPLNQNDAYTKQRSLQAIKRDVAHRIDFKQSQNPDSGEVYNRLRDLFFAIDAGDARLDLPPYNGRLFSDADHPFLADKAVGDSYLVPALDKLARLDLPDERRESRRVFVDYRDLAVRHLGSIYEKLLEYDLDLAAAPLALKDGQYAPAKTTDSAIKTAGQVYLRTGSNERKVTGSYYTPDYIVRFIVEKTLEPLLTAITARHADQDESGQWQVRADAASALIHEVLALNVLDPATGSGHFAVDATAYIAEHLRSLALRPADLGDEDELIYWKRQVASACIYAVDINPLAVELAKLSMWLTTLAKGKPLSFLNHHIRVGNSLVGTSIFDINDADVVSVEEQKRRKARATRAAARAAQAAAHGQLNMFSDADFSDGMRFAIDQMTQIENTIAADVSDVKRQEAMYSALTNRLSAWKQAADVWTARAFGLSITPEQWKAVRKFTTEYTAGGAGTALPPTIQKLVDAAAAIDAQQHFFHWELNFPEIFFDASGAPKADPGFDAVIGNPPYVRMEKIRPIKPFLQNYYAVHESRADLFLYFYERGLSLLKQEHRLGYISSGTYMNSNSAKPFRQYIHDNAGMEWVANFGENQPFRGAEMVYPTIAVMRNGARHESFHNLFIEDTIPFVRLGETLDNGEWVKSLGEATSMDEWRFQPAALTLLFKKVTSGIATLKDVTSGHLFSGVKTGLNEAFIVDEATRDKLVNLQRENAEIIKPMVRGQDLRPWYQHQTQYLIYAYRGVQIEKYPAVYEYLTSFRKALESRATIDTHQWYELQQPQTGIHSHFEAAKIFWPDIAKLPRFSWDEQSLYLNEKCFIVAKAKLSLLAILNSRIAWFVLSQLATPLRLRAGLWQYQSKIQFVERLPIPDLTAEQESGLAAIAEEITALARQRYSLHEDLRTTLSADFGAGQAIGTRVGLYEWWKLADDHALDEELKRQFRTELPLNQRGRWRSFLAEQKAEHGRLTDSIIALETRLNTIVYDAFALTPDERGLIESTTKYPYGEV